MLICLALMQFKREAIWTIELKYPALEIECHLMTYATTTKVFNGKPNGSISLYRATQNEIS